MFSGLLFPLAMLPGPLRWVAEALPLTPVAELLRLALTWNYLAAAWSPPRAGRDLQRGRHPGARAHRLDRGGRVGGTTLVPLGTAALGRRDTLEG